MNSTGDNYDSSNFNESIFGTSLAMMCRLIENPALEELWRTSQSQCTIAFIRDVSELFMNLLQFIEYRAGVLVEACGITNVQFENRAGTSLAIPAEMGKRHH